MTKEEIERVMDASGKAIMQAGLLVTLRNNDDAPVKTNEPEWWVALGLYLACANDAIANLVELVTDHDAFLTYMEEE